MPPRLYIPTVNCNTFRLRLQPLCTGKFISRALPQTTATNRLSHIQRQFLTSPKMASNENSKKFQISNLFDVKDRIALVTGGGTGIGLMATQALASNGAKVYICGRTEEKLEKVAEMYGKDIPGQIIPVQADVSKKDSIRELVKYISEREKCLCILINNAGIELNTQKTEADSAEEMSKNLFEDENETFETWTATYRTNVAQGFFMTMAFLPLLQKATEHHYGYSGTAINITSMSGIVKTAQHHFAYNASKAAAVHLTTMLSSEIAANKLKIRVNAVAPGVFPSEMTAGGSGEDQKSHVEKEKYEDKTAAQRPGKEEDMASAILFVATNQYLNGQNVIVDGGYVMKAGGGP